MSTHTDKIDSHSIYTDLSNVQDELATVEAMQDKPPLAVETLARISMIVKNFSLSIENSDKNFVSTTWLDEGSRAFANIKSYLTNYKSNKDANALANNTSTQLDVLLQVSAKLNCVKSKRSLRGIFAAGNEYTRIMDLHNEQLHEKVQLLEDEIVQLQKRITEQDNLSQKNLSELQSAITSEKQRLDGFATSYQDQMARDKNAFSDMSSSLKDSFASAQEDRKKIFSEEVEQITKQCVAIDQKASSQREEIRTQGDQLIAEYRKKFDDYEQQVANIVGIVNTNMFSHKYKEVADDAHKRAKFWHGLAVFLMVAVGAFAVYAFVITANDDTSWVKLVAKIFATTTLVTGAAYAARQASKQEKVERYARKIEMELVAIDPFISTLEESKRSLLKEELAKKIFGNPDAMEISSKDEAYTAMDKLTSIEDLLQSIAALIAKVSK